MGYGISCLATSYMVAEFKRYQLSHLRLLAGWTQISSSLLLLAGLRVDKLFLCGSILIAAMMLFGLFVRKGIGDSAVKMFPAFFYLLLNVFFIIAYLRWDIAPN